VTIVYSNDFNVTVDTNLNAFGLPDFYIVRQAVANDTKVMAATDRVEFPGFGQVDFGCGLFHSLIGGINDYEVVALVRRATDRDMGMVGARCGIAVASSINYMVGSDANNDLVLYRGNGGGVVAIKTTPASIPTNAEMIVRLRVSGETPVLLEYSIDGISDTHSDSDAGRLQTGPPGIFYGRQTVSVEEVWLDQFRVSNDLSGIDFAVGGGGGGADGSDDAQFEGHLLEFQAHLAYMRGGKKRKRKPHFMIESEVLEAFKGK
jgi:hypothetical protein